MTFEEVVTELRGKFPKADVSAAATRGETAQRAAGLSFKRDKGGLYAGKDADGTEVLVYYNDTADLICCTEIEPDNADDE
jgi:hypothetical protein